MRRVLLVAMTTGYQTRAFGEAADRLGVELVLATDRCHQLDDPWRDGAVPVRFHDEPGFLGSITHAASRRPLTGVLGVGENVGIIPCTSAQTFLFTQTNPGSPTIVGTKKRSVRCFHKRPNPVSPGRRDCEPYAPLDSCGQSRTVCYICPGFTAIC